MYMKRKLLSLLLLVVVGGANCAWADNWIGKSGVTFEGNANMGTVSIDGTSLTYTPGGNTYKLQISSTGIEMPTKRAFFAIEINDPNYSSGNVKIRNIKVSETDDTKYDSGDALTKKVVTLSNGNKLIIICPITKLNNNYGSVLLDYETLHLSSMEVEIASGGNGSACVISNVGFYSLGELLTLYSSEENLLKCNFQFVSPTDLRFESYNENNNGDIKFKSAGAVSIDQIKLIVKIIDFANIPTKWSCFSFGGLQPSEATTEDLFNTMLSTQRLRLDKAYMFMLPTLHKPLDVADNQRLWQFVDGIAPESTTAYQGSGGNWGSITREFKAGYNSMMLPMKYLASYDSDNLTFYKVNSYDAGVISFDKVSEDNIKTGNWKEEPFIVHANRAGLYTMVGRDADNTLTGYKTKNCGGDVYFVGSYVNEIPSGDYTAGANCVNYGITSDGTQFAKMEANDTKTTYYRAFLCDKRASGARALSLSFDDGNGTTAIVSPEAVEGLTLDTYFDLQGRRVNNPTKGLYIVNGKKMFIK